MERPAPAGRRHSPGGALPASLRIVQPHAWRYRLRRVIPLHDDIWLRDGAGGRRRAIDAAGARYSSEHPGPRLPAGAGARTGPSVSTPKPGPRDGVGVDDFHRTSVEYDVLLLRVAEIRAAGSGC